MYGLGAARVHRAAGSARQSRHRPRGRGDERTRPDRRSPRDRQNSPQARARRTRGGRAGWARDGETPFRTVNALGRLGPPFVLLSLYIPPRSLIPFRSKVGLPPPQGPTLRSTLPRRIRPAASQGRRRPCLSRRVVEPSPFGNLRSRVRGWESHARRLARALAGPRRRVLRLAGVGGRRAARWRGREEVSVGFARRDWHVEVASGRVDTSIGQLRRRAEEPTGAP